MQIKLLAEGSTKWERFIKHWGISFLIGDDVLFDTFGDAGVFWRNLKGMRVDLDKIRHIIISHDHWDHLAGLWLFLDKHKYVTVYICPGFSQETKERIASLGVPVVEVAGPMEIKAGIYTTGQIKGIYAGRDIYEQAIVIKNARGLAIITGCAHPGIATIVNKVREYFSEPLLLVAGGFHLKEASQETIGKIIDMLKSIGVQKVAPLHCSGALAQDIFKRAWGQDYIGLTAGKVLELEPEEDSGLPDGNNADGKCCVKGASWRDILSIKFFKWWFILTALYSVSAICPFCGQSGCPTGAGSIGIIGGLLAFFMYVPKKMHGFWHKILGKINKGG